MINMVGAVAASVAGLVDVDVDRGRAALPGRDGARSWAMWTKDRRRVTVTFCADGGLVAACGEGPDPEWPAERLLRGGAAEARLAAGARLGPVLTREDIGLLSEAVDDYMDWAQVWHKQAGGSAASDTVMVMIRMEKWARRLKDISGKPTYWIHDINAADKARARNGD